MNWKRSFSRRHLPQPQIILRRHPERIGDSIEESKQRRDVNAFGNLLFLPACDSQLLNIFSRGALSGIGDQFDVVHQDALCLRQPGVIQFSFQHSGYTLIIGSLNPRK